MQESRKHYEMDVRSHADALDRQARRGVVQVCVFLCGKTQHNVYKCARVKYVLIYCQICVQESREYAKFLKKSHDAALKEQERRHRFLAEKHCGLVQSISQLMNKVHRYPKIAFQLPKVHEHSLMLLR